MNLNTVAAALSQSCPINLELTGVCTDSRLIKPGNLFVALSGEHFDGHAFVHAVEQQGAVAAVVQKRVDGVQMPQFVVEDTLIALAQIATAHRRDMHLPVIALTGSNGKTTVKEMISSILPSPSLATKGNLNNHIGAPLSVLALTPEHRYAVFELGANHLGEIAHTVAVVQPKVALINNIAPAHVEGFGSIEGVARAKGEIYNGLASDGIAVVNDDDVYAHFWDDLIGDRTIIRFSMDHVADVYVEQVKLDVNGCAQYTLVLPSGRIEMHLQVPGLHNVRNSLAAAACCYALGLSIKEIEQGLNNFSGVKGRMTLLTGINQCTVIDDTYNANLRSVLAGLEVLAARPGNQVFVFGDMGELGEWAVPHHQEVGVVAQRLGVHHVLTCGSYSHFTSEAFGDGGLHFENQESLVGFLVNKLDSNTTVLVKGSRSSAMEKIVSKLLN